MDFRKTLVAAHLGSTLVRVSRRRGWDDTTGYVAAVGTKWVLIATVDGQIRADGVSAVRLRDIRKIVTRPNQSFHRAHLALHGEWPPTWAAGTATPDLDSTGGLLTSLSTAYPLISLFTEGRDYSVCYIGVLEPGGRRRAHLHEVTPAATWSTRRRSWRYKRISRLDAGGGYETALIVVAGPPRPRT